MEFNIEFFLLNLRLVHGYSDLSWNWIVSGTKLYGCWRGVSKDVKGRHPVGGWMDGLNINWLSGSPIRHFFYCSRRVPRCLILFYFILFLSFFLM